MLAQLADNGARVATHSRTGYVRFIGAAPENPLPQPVDLPSPATQLQAAQNLISHYGVLFGLTKPNQELTVERLRILEDGRGVTRFQQVYQGIPVLGGELMLQTNANYQMLAALGEFLPDISISTTPSIDLTTAGQTALDLVSKTYQIDRSGLTATDPQLWVYNPILIGPGDGPTRLVWRVEVKPVDVFPLRELVLVDAQRGGVTLHFNQVDTARVRATYTANNSTGLPGTLVCNESNPTCSGGDSHAVAAHRFAGATYDFYSTYHGRDSIDNAGMEIKSTVHYDYYYDNAFWDGAQMVYGDGYGFPLADDVVAHELSHGVTEHESNLFYYYQAGAMNESLSDLWGEFVDLTDGAGNDTSSVRWLLGEDIPGLGAIRNMKNPPAFHNPDKMTSSYYDFDPSFGDNGGVHTNSSINNKAVYLMTDGGTFNGYTISGLGITKVAKIYYEAQTNLLVSGSDYNDLHEALYQGCLNLIGTNSITAANCQQVRNATLAVQMNLQPASGYNPDAEICPSGQTPVNTFYDNFENGFSNWTLAALSGTNLWFTTDPNGVYSHSGTKYLYGDDYSADSDSTATMVSGVILPTNSYLHFYHSFGLENEYDGGVIEYSANGGAWTDGGSLINSGKAYNGSIPAWNNRPAFSDLSNGYVSTRLNLSALAGQTVKFRFRLRTDIAYSVHGWWVDDVRIYNCSSGPPSISTEIHNAGHSPVNSEIIGKGVHAKVAVTGSNGTPAGTVSFTVFTNMTCSGTGASAGTVALVNGVADPSNTVTLTISGLSFKAHYNGGGTYTAADGACKPLAANKLSAATQLNSSENPSEVGDTVTFTVQVSSGVLAPTGVVTITVDGAAVPLSLAPSGIATYMTNTLTAGSHTIRAFYSGDSNFNPCTATQLIQSVGLLFYLPSILNRPQASAQSLPPLAGILPDNTGKEYWIRPISRSSLT